MRWIKHFTDNHRGKSVQYLLDELGYFGPFFKDTVLEMCAEKLDQKEDRELTDEDCWFVFHRRVISSATRAKPSTVRRALVAGASCDFWSFITDGEYFRIYAPILLDLLEYDQKKSRPRRAQIAPGSRLEKRREEESREDKNLPAVKEKPNTELNKKIWESYRDAYSARYGVDPVRNATVNAKISALGKRLGEEAVEIIHFYVFHNDSFFIKNAHSIGLALAQAESLATQWRTGKQITNNEVRRFEKAQVFESMAKDAEKGGF